MTAALDSDSARISDSFYHLQGGRVFEGRIGDVNGSGFVQGSLSVNPYFELKISSGDAVYMVKHVVAGGRRVASVYEQVGDYSARGMGCASIGSRVAVAGHRECLAAAFAILFVPLFIALLVGTRFFTRGGFREHPLRSALALIVLVVFLVEFSPLVSVDLDLANPLHKKELYKNLNLLLNAAYQNGKIPKSKAALEFFENLKHARSSDGLRLSFGPRVARADEIEKDVLYFHADQLGSTRVVTRGGDGSVYSYNNYLPFGKMLEGQTMGGEILPDYALFKNSYTGQEADRTTGLYFYQSRFYDADLGRFTQADTVVPRPTDNQSYNRYTYVDNNPYKYIDPTGEFLLPAAIAFAVINAGITAALGGTTQQIIQAGLAGFIIGGISGGLYFSGFENIAQGAVMGAMIGNVSATISGGNVASGMFVGAAFGAAGAAMGNYLVSAAGKASGYMANILEKSAYMEEMIQMSIEFGENFFSDMAFNAAWEFRGGTNPDWVQTSLKASISPASIASSIARGPLVPFLKRQGWADKFINWHPLSKLGSRISGIFKEGSRISNSIDTKFGAWDTKASEWIKKQIINRQSNPFKNLETGKFSLEILGSKGEGYFNEVLYGSFLASAGDVSGRICSERGEGLMQSAGFVVGTVSPIAINYTVDRFFVSSYHHKPH